jgi:hypothetical protein
MFIAIHISLACMFFVNMTALHTMLKKSFTRVVKCATVHAYNLDAV